MPRSTNTTKVGDILEIQIRDYFAAEIDADRLFFKKSCCKVFRKKGYFSKDRNAEIIFDVSIEVYLPGSDKYSFLFLIECKNYNGPVPVNDIEEFYTKVQQVASANSKSILASTSAFQTGTRAFAKSKGIGLLRYFQPDKVKWELMRSPSNSSQPSSLDNPTLVQEGLSENDFHSFFFDFYLQSPTRETNSLWDFFEDFLDSENISLERREKFRNVRTRSLIKIPYIEKEDLEALGEKITSPLKYSDGEVDLSKICQIEFKKTGLVVNIIPSSHVDNGVLGRITFTPPVIDLYEQKMPNRGRDRFTLAHELAHYYLSHGDFLRGEYCEDEDFNSHRAFSLDEERISRLEFQANYLAASILMPRAHFLADFKKLVELLQISNRGYGQLYLDNQTCNVQNFDFVTSQLVLKYGVSRTAVKIRLESMDLLKDVRNENFKPVRLGSLLSH